MWLWIRDKAGKMKRPSIDRINSGGNYTLNNCRFIELSANIHRSLKERYDKRSNQDFCKNGHQFIESNTYWWGKEKSYRECRTCKKERSKKNWRINKV